MSLPEDIRTSLALPAFCAPMFLVSTPALVREACLAGIVGGLPRHNARSIEEFEAWLREIRDALDRRADEEGAAPCGPIAVNLSSKMPGAEMERNLALCARYGVRIIVNATGNPTEVAQRAHEHGMLAYADAVNMRFAHKAMAAGVDGITVIGAGGGGHSGTLNPLSFVARVREEFAGTIVLGGGISTGAGIRAAQVLGADLAYLGTRFIATRESGAADDYKALLVSQTSSDLVYSAAITGVAASWLSESLRRQGVVDGEALPEGAVPWKTLWSAGHGIDQIRDIPGVRELVERLKGEYRAADQRS